MRRVPVLIILAGLPGVGKTTIAREVARETGAVHVRIDSIEQHLRDSGEITGPMDDAGYRIAYAIAEQNLRRGCSVIADCVNPLELTRNAWRDTARRSGAGVVEVEVICSDQNRHRHRVEHRKTDIPGLRLPSWDDVLARKYEYEPWDREHIIVDNVIDTRVKEAVLQILHALALTNPAR